MNIREAKEQIQNAVTAYLAKDEYGQYEIPLEAQRPILLMGAPGIGKTAIVGQIAREMGLGLVSYSMTHHTRQSALGLPVIRHKCFEGQEYEVSEYTMSEIIAQVYSLMERTGLREGILFLDEINCVSETLAPSMLQFLQFKTFGCHRVPPGWVIVTAGNPPAYNRSVREFDVVTLDRLKKIVVEPDFAAWKDYASAQQIHPSVMSYLGLKKDCFYRVESTADGKRFVTARGWEDLSRMLRLYEKLHLPVEAKLVGQYLQEERICADFSAYYELFHKYSADYAVQDILNGRAGEAVLERARAARFDERYALVGLLLDAIHEPLERALTGERTLELLLHALKQIKPALDTSPLPDLLDAQKQALQQRLADGEQTGLLPARERRALHWAMDAMDICEQAVGVDGGAVGAEVFQLLRNDLANRIADHDRCAALAGGQLTALFTFAEQAFPDGQELLILVTELTVNPTSAEFIRRYGCEKYFAHNKDLLFYERRKEIDERLYKLDLSGL